ncbi:MAG: lipopolysaccharide biosynthesis protein [Gammaproteobacteria bacterium]
MLKHRAAAATAWSGADILIRQGLQFAVSIALARLLGPEEFGTIALLYLFTGVAGVVVDSGFGSALVQQQDITPVDESTVFWWQLGAGFLAACVLVASAPAIAGYFSEPLLVPLMASLALAVVAGAAGGVHAAMLTRRLDFRTQLRAGAVATLVSGLVAVAMAWNGSGVWALAAQVVTMAAVNTAMLWWLTGWRPKRVFSVASMGRLFGFGGYLLAANLSDMVYTRGYNLLIGKLHGVRELGFYSRADGTQQLPVAGLSAMLSRVALPMFSAAAADRAQIRRGAELAVRAVMLLNVPMMLGLAAVAEPFVEAVFGPKWLPAVPILQVLCLAGVLWPLHVLNLNMLLAQGHSRLVLKLELPKKLIGICLLVVGSLLGVMGVAWSQVATGLIAFAINAHYSRRLFGYGAATQLRDFFPAMAVALPMAAIVYAIGRWWHAGAVTELFALAGLGIVVFSAFAWTAGLKAVAEVRALVPRHHQRNDSAA